MKKNLAQTKRTRAARSLTALAAGALVVASLFVSAAPATAATAALSGTQNGSSTVYWATARTNAQTNGNRMSVSPWNGTNLGVPSFTAGKRNSSGAVASQAKTGTFYAGGSSAFTMVSTGSANIPLGIFYITTSLGPAGCGCDNSLSWTGTLYYNLPY